MRAFLPEPFPAAENRRNKGDCGEVANRSCSQQHVRLRPGIPAEAVRLRTCRYAQGR